MQLGLEIRNLRGRATKDSKEAAPRVAEERGRHPKVAGVKLAGRRWWGQPANGKEGAVFHP